MKKRGGQIEQKKDVQWRREEERRAGLSKRRTSNAETPSKPYRLTSNLARLGNLFAVHLERRLIPYVPCEDDADSANPFFFLASAEGGEQLTTLDAQQRFIPPLGLVMIYKLWYIVDVSVE